LLRFCKALPVNHNSVGDFKSHWNNINYYMIDLAYQLLGSNKVTLQRRVKSEVLCKLVVHVQMNWDN
jgi:hypothetical protein